MTKTVNRHRAVQVIKSFQAKAMRRRTFAERMADSLTLFFGSMTFLIINIVVFGIWVFFNSPMIIQNPFDPYPYMLLTTFVSLEAIILTIVVLMSQNREGKVATLRDELQLQVELISEKEITKLLGITHELLETNGIKVTDEELLEMLAAVDTSYIEKKLKEQLDGKQSKSLRTKLLDEKNKLHKKA